MARWRPLSAELRPEVRRLVERLRLLKDRTGLSLTSLAAKTSFSTSSWHRYFGAITFPPWKAVDELGTLSGAQERDLARLRAMWESAREAWQKPSAGADPTKAPGVGRVPPTAGHSSAGIREGITIVVRTMVAALTLVLLASVPDSSRTGADAPEWPWSLTPPGPTAPVYETVQCRQSACEGRDPVRTGCQRGGRVLGRYDRKEHRIQLLHSAQCRTVWGEVAPAKGVDDLSISAPGAAQLREGAGAERTRMVAVLDTIGTGAQACAVLSGEHSCVDADGRAWTG